MDQLEFESALQRDGFDEIGVKGLVEAPRNSPHSHGFDARALVLEGEITLTVEGEPTTYREGEVYDVPAGTSHSETVPTGGVRYVYGLRHPTS